MDGQEGRGQSWVLTLLKANIKFTTVEQPEDM